MSQPGGGVLATNAGALTSAIAAALEETARDLAGAAENTEILVAQLPPTPGITDTLAKLKLRAELVGIAHAYFKEMAAHPETPVVFDRAVYGVLGATSPTPRCPYPHCPGPSCRRETCPALSAVTKP